MKRLLLGIVLAAFSLLVHATTLNPIQLLNPTGSSSGQAIVSTGASSAPAWGGVGLNGIAAIAGNTLIGNATSSSAVPTAVSVSNCAGTSSALNYTGGSGFSCNGSINALTVSGNAVGTSGGTIPLLNGVNTWSGAQTFSALITPSPTIGIKGTAGNDSANAGSIGEIVSSTATAVAITSNTATNVTSISLTAGDWEVTGLMGTAPAGSTTQSAVYAGPSTTSAAFQTLSGSFLNLAGSAAPVSAGGVVQVPLPVTRFSLSATTTVFMVASVTYSVSTLTVNGLLRARRVR
jgi:hypothetical protein